MAYFNLKGLHMFCFLCFQIHGVCWQHYLTTGAAGAVAAGAVAAGY